MKTLNADEVKRILDSGEKVVLLDVRSPAEYLRTKISYGINLPYEEIKATIEEIVSDKKTKIIVYCLSGSRSMVGAQDLADIGYSNVFDMENGLLGWRAKGYPLE